ncbi:phasin family protein [Oceanobacillus bengalensis]|uniref:Polyhydroxyalkanoate synthesis regulator n=1 Tax=Oceanobacillus bengalensis TaxID=1435466 RepID=A0A494YYW8_9BACI|nr:hypothetical protein [Oceanobacillus bengalensis]RKQ15420.1 hypothetical protein D8M05_10515 [Oceanobacillus bengalensis]
MSDYLKKGFLLGLGAAVSGKEKLEQKLKELVDKNELSQEQAKSMMNDFIEKGDSKKEEWSQKQKEQMLKMAKELGLATKDDVDELRKRINDLEMKITDKEEQ